MTLVVVVFVLCRKKNFEKMNKMETVLLNNNEIETVEDYTFEDCPQLKQVSVGELLKRRIKPFLN